MIRFRLYDRNGTTLLGLLPDLISYQIGIEFSEVGAMAFEYPVGGINASSITELREIGIVQENGDEYDNARFVITSINRDRVEKDGVISVSARNILWRLDTALAYPDGGVGSGEITRYFDTKTAGFILKTLFDAAQTRGALSGMSVNFSNTTDSNNAAWPDTVTQEYPARTSLLAVLRGLQEFGIVEVKTNGRVLWATKADGIGADRTTGNSPLILRYGYNLTEAPELVNAERLASAALLEGDDGILVERTNAGAISTYGRLETSFTASGIDDTAVVTALGDAYLAGLASADRQLTVGLTLQEGAPFPLKNFNVGDYVYTVTTAGLERVRVRQLTISMSDGQISATATLGDRIFESEIRNARRLNAITSGSVNLGNGELPSQAQDVTPQLVANNPHYGPTAPANPLNGALWFNTSEGNKLYRFNSTTGQWVAVQDTAIATAQSTADGKNRIFRQSSAPGGSLAAGDLWFDTANDNRIFRYDGATWVLNSLGNNAIASLSASKLTAGTIDASVITVSNINAGNISTGTISSIAINNGNGTFAVTSAGALTASSATITGNVTADSGRIGGFTLGAQQIGNANGTYMSTNGNMACDVMTIRASAGSTGINFSNAAILALSGGTLSMGAGTISMAGGTINLGNSGTINASNGTINAGTISGTGNITTTQSITATNDITANRDLFTPNHSTVTDAANGRVTIAAGRVTRSTASSERYKENITPIRDIEELDPKKLLDIPVRAFTYREDYLSDTDSRFGALIPGFIAEEVDAVYPVAADYEDGQVESWNDRMIVPGLLALVQDLYQRIEELENRA